MAPSEDGLERSIYSLFTEELERCDSFDVGQALPAEEGEFTPLSPEEYQRLVSSLPPPTRQQVLNLAKTYLKDDNFIIITRGEPHQLLLTVLPADITGSSFPAQQIELCGHLYAFVINEEGYCQEPNPNGCFPAALFPEAIARAGMIPVRWASPDAESPVNFEQEFLAAAERLIALLWPPDSRSE